MKIFLVSAGAALALATAAYADHHGAGAQGAGKGKTDGGWEAKVEKHFAEVDADKNGAVTEAEMIAWATAKAKADFAAAAAGDDKVTLEEAKAHHRAKHEAMMEDHGGMDHGKKPKYDQ
jgi:hypothetical protein